MDIQLRNSLKAAFLESISNKNGIKQDYMEPNPDINKLKEYYVAKIDDMEECVIEGQWPQTFDQIEKHFDRPNKTITPETKLKDKQSKENRDTNKIAEKDKPFAI
jgi:hypothetical protein